MHSHFAGDNQQTTMWATHHLEEWGDSETVTTKIASEEEAGVASPYCPHARSTHARSGSMFGWLPPDLPTRRSTYEIARPHLEGRENSWCSRSGVVWWSNIIKECVACSQSLEQLRSAASPAIRLVWRQVCGRSNRRLGLKQYQCVKQYSKSVWEQSGDVCWLVKLGNRGEWLSIVHI